MTIQDLKERLELPLIAAPMFIISREELVIACCKNGIVGSFPALNGRSNEAFEGMLKGITDELKEWEKETGKKAAPYAVNLIVHRTNSRLQADLKTCVKYQVPIVITSLGAVKDVVDVVHSYGGIVLHDIIKKRHAEKAAEAGVDGIICVAAGAGGHAGLANPFSLVSEVKQFYDGALILAGSINRGNEILAAQIIGADFAYMGTRFIATKECAAPDAYKTMILQSGIDDVLYTDAVSGVHGNFLKKSMENAGFTSESSGNGGLEKLYDTEAKAWKDIWSAGQGVTEIHDIPSVGKLIDRLKSEYNGAIIDIENLV